MSTKLKIAFTLSVIVVLICTLCGCKNNKTTSIYTTLQIDKNFSGSRTMTCNFSSNTIGINSEQEYFLDSLIESNCPKIMEYKKLSNDAYISYIFTINFSSKDEYSSKLSSIMGLNPNITLCESSTIFTNGSIVYEDFDSLDILSFIPQKMSKDPNLKNVKTYFNCAETQLILGDSTYKTDNKIHFNNMDYNPINSISIDTKNTLNNTFDRTITISIPSSTYNKLGDSILSYMNSRIDNNFSFNSEWIDTENSKDFKISYYNLSMENLRKVTSMILNSTFNDSIKYYYDSENTSVLKKQQIFEEYIDTSSYLTESAKPVLVNYTYSSPKSLNSGFIYNKFNWEPFGQINNNDTFSATNNNLITKLKILEIETFIPDSIDIDLVVEGNGHFSRNINLNYTKDNLASFNYSINYLIAIPNINISPKENDENLICHSSISGSIDELDNCIKKMFGSENHISYSIKENKFRAYNNAVLTDKFCIKSSLLNDISGIPLKYTIHEKNKKDTAKLTYTTPYLIKTVDSTDFNSGVKDDISINLNVSDIEIEYNSNILNPSGVFFIVGMLIIYFIFVFSIIIFVKHKTNKKISKKTLKKNNSKKGKNIDEILSDI